MTGIISFLLPYTCIVVLQLAFAQQKQWPGTLKVMSN